MLGISALIAISLVTQAPHYSKRALLVGAWDYRSKLWPNLSSDHDVDLIKSTLVSRFGWTPDKGGEIVVLTSRADTTRKSIIDHFKSVLATDVQDGDTIYFHYSGHGYQAPDTDPAKDPSLKITAPVNPLIGNSPSGLDQTIMPTDDPDHNANQIRNDELGLLVKQVIDAAKGKHVNVLVTMDACHSGGGTRGIARTVRGRPYDGPIPKVVADYDPTSPEAVFLGKVSGYTYISACRSDQEAGEALGPDKRTYGRFSLALCDTLSRCSNTTSYRQLFDLVDEYMASKWTFGSVDAFSENPQLEGDDRKMVFGASAAKPSPYIALLPLDQGHYQLKGGSLQGITEGSILKLYGSSDPDKPLASLTAAKVGIVDSSFVATPPLSTFKPAQLAGARAVLVAQGTSEVATSVDISAIKTSSQFEQIKSAIAARVPSAVLSEQPDKSAAIKVEFADSNSDKAGFRIFRGSSAAEVTAEPIVDNAPDAIADRVFGELRYAAISRMSNEFPAQGHSVEVRAVPCETSTQGDGVLGWVKDAPVPEGAWNVGTYFALQVRVVGNWEPYVAILDLTSDGAVSVLWPLPQYFGDSVQMHRPFTNGKPDPSWQYLRLPNTDQVAVFKVTPPLGKEMMKMVASERPLPFRDLLSTNRGATEKLTPLGGLFNRFATVTKRSQAENADPGELWSTRQVVITVSGGK